MNRSDRTTTVPPTANRDRDPPARGAEAGTRSARVATIAVSAAGLLVVAYTAGILAGVWEPAAASGPELDPARTRPVALGLAGAVGYLALALFTALRSAERPEAAAIALALGGIGLNGAIASLVPVHAAPFLTPLAKASWIFGATAFVRGTQLFPRPLRRADFPADAADGPIRRLIRRYLLAFLGPARVWLGFGALLVVAFAVGSPAVTVARLVVLATGFLFFRHAYRVADAEGRRRIGWLLLGVVVALAVAALNLALMALAALAELDAFPLRTVGQVLGTISTFGVLACLALAIFYGGALDPRLAIHRTAMVAGAASLLLFLVGLLSQVVHSVLAARLGLQGPVTSAIGGTLIGLAFRPLWDRISGLLRRRLGLPASPAAAPAATAQPAPGAAAQAAPGAVEVEPPPSPAV